GSLHWFWEPGVLKGTKVMTQPRHSCGLGHLIKHTTEFSQDVIQEVFSFALNEQHATEQFKVSKDKQALKFIQKMLGTHICAKRKARELSNVLATTREAVAKGLSPPQQLPSSR
uniref:Large ribosomal subunit protein eL36 n=1 Tax=Bos indicus x Bos taurus TaxID=30522 RepID=A0A4W2DZ25_BOBOX